MLTKSQLWALIDSYRRAEGGNQHWYYRDQLHVALEEIYDAPREWVEAEPNTKGMRLRDVLANNKTRGTVIWHSNKPVTNNPVWEVLGQA